VKILVVAIAVLLALGGWLWTPDKPRAALEAKYTDAASEFLQVAGMGLHVRRNGPTDAPPVLLLHGFGASLLTWDPWVALLPGYRIIRFDLPGFGLTGPDPTGDYSDPRSIEVIVALMDALGVRRASIVGHSMGGRIAWKFAAAQPERVDKLVLIAPDGFASPGFEYGRAPQVPAWLNLMRYSLPRAMFRMNLAPGYADPAVVTDTLVDRYYDMMLAPGIRGAVIARMKQTVLQDPVPLLRGIRAPTLIIWGQQDAMIPSANAADYRRALPDSKLVLLAGTGHLPHEEAPSVSVEPLKAFLSVTK